MTFRRLLRDLAQSLTAGLLSGVAAAALGFVGLAPLAVLGVGDFTWGIVFSACVGYFIGCGAVCTGIWAAHKLLD